MVEITSLNPFDPSHIKFPNGSAFEVIKLVTGGQHVSFFVDGFYTVSLHGPFHQSNPHDVVSQIDMLNVMDEVVISFSGLALDEANLTGIFAGTSTTRILSNLLGSDDTLRLSDSRDRAFGFSGSDKIWGGKGNDTLDGGSGADQLFGQGARDVLIGGLGADTIVGGAGRDHLTGGSGADVFVFDTTVSANTSADVIADFKVVDDSVQIENAVFTAFAYTGALRSANLRHGNSAVDADDFLIYHKSTGSLWYDADGKGGLAQVLIAEFTDGTALTRADIFLI